jgi:AcrR family transcriptional regulator
MTSAKRTRLSPHDRRMQLLDCAQVIIQEQGLSSFTMEALAKQAGVSNPLIYKYFDTRLALLQELLEREFHRFYTNIRNKLNEAKDYVEVVHIVVSVNFDERTNGNILNILRDQPDIRQALVEVEVSESGKLARFLVKALADHYTLTRSQAEEITAMGAGASQAAAEHYSRFGGDKQTLIDNTVKFIFGGIERFVS